MALCSRYEAFFPPVGAVLGDQRLPGPGAAVVDDQEARSAHRGGCQITARETIVALATASAAAGVGIVRLSGPRSRQIAETLCARPLQDRRASHHRFVDADGEVIDDGIAILYLAPRSYTGEDVVELQAHGSPVLLARLQRCCMAWEHALRGQASSPNAPSSRVGWTCPGRGRCRSDQRRQ